MVQEQPDATLAELCQRLAARTALQVSLPTMYRALDKPGLHRKKRPYNASEQDTPRVRKLRRVFIREVAGIPARQLVSVDESGATTSMIRIWGRAQRRQRVSGAVPQSRWQVTTMLGALRAEGLAAAMTIPAAADTEVLMAFVQQVLVPALRPDEAVLLDNLSPHQVAGVQEAIQAVGVRVLHLPPYSPDLNPIEPCRAMIKESLRAAGARDQDHLESAIARAFQTVTAHDGKAFFEKCGHIVH